MKKLFLLLIILGVGYMISIFLAPNIADKIGNILGIKSFNESVRSNGGNFNRTFTNIPSVDELEKGYNDVVKTAKEYGNEISNGIDKTKETIDNIRVTLSGAEDKIENAKKTYSDIKESYEKTMNTVNEIKKNINEVEKIGNAIQNITNTGTTNTGTINN